MNRACLLLAARYGKQAPPPADPALTAPEQREDARDLSAVLERRLSRVLPQGWQLRVDAAGPSTDRRLPDGYYYGLNVGTPLREETPHKAFAATCADLYDEATRILEKRGQLAELTCRLDRLSLLGR